MTVQGFLTREPFLTDRALHFALFLVMYSVKVPSEGRLKREGFATYFTGIGHV